MSQENVEIVRRTIDEYNETGDVPWEAIDRDVEWVIPTPAFVAGTYRGHEGLRSLLTRLAEAFDRVQFDFDKYVGADDSVVALGRSRIRGQSSGITTGQPLGYVFWVREGRIAAARAYLRPEEALEAVGLRE
jgi:ketosteroid isomerase-like protein